MLKSHANYETPRPAKGIIEFTTKFKETELVTRVANFELMEMKRSTKFSNNVELPSVEEIRDYLTTLLQLRVEYTTEQGLKEYSRFVRTVRIPARWYTIISNVGIAKNSALGFHFVPESTFTKLPLEEMKRISDLMELILEDGYSTIGGMPKSTEGSLYFMAKTIIDNTVRSMEIDSPVYGFLASIVSSEIINDTYQDLDLLFRVRYSDTDTYALNFNDFFRNLGSDEPEI